MGKKTPVGNWKRETNRERNKPEPTVLVGFGKFDLVDFIGSRDLVNEAFVKGFPPRYRPASRCTEEEINLFKEFTTWLTQESAK